MNQGNKESQKKIARIKEGNYNGAALVVIVISVLICLFSIQYYKKLHTTIRDESKGYLQEVSKRIGSNLDRILEDNFAMLNMLGASIEMSDLHSVEEIQTFLQKQQSYAEFETVLLVDRTGKAYSVNDSSSVFFVLEDSFRKSLLNKEQKLATTQVINNKEYFVFGVSLNNVTVEGEEVIALAACYDPETLDKVLSMASFDEQAYSQIVTKSGTLVTKNNASDAMKSGYNIFSTLEKADIDDDVTVEDIKKDMQNDILEQVSFTKDGISRYMVYTPIQPDEWYLLTFVPVQTVNEKSDMLLTITLVICGLIIVTFGILVSLLLYTFRANRKKLERLAFVDVVTDGNTIQKFYDQAREILDANPNAKYTLVYSNIENFKILNAQMGRKNCDIILKHFNTYAMSTLSAHECMGRLFADNFCILMNFKSEKELLVRFEDWANGAEAYIQKLEVTWGMPVTEFGVYVIEDIHMEFPEMIDRAKLALKEFSRTINSKMRYAFYDEKARFQLFREKQLADMMEGALENREFQMYLQPKYHLPEERIGGAEALVRWVSSAEGMIYPNEFIPLFEKNGFIVALDLWMFEEVCRTLSSWIERGLKPVKISVNCSRVHFRNPDFLKSYLKIVEKYEIDRGLLEIELTESVVFESMDQLTEIIRDIRAAGFGCSMDDFGSGYSSLNLIQSIPVDTLKIDKVFFRKSRADSGRMEAVVGSIIQMAHSLSMITVAEGVEYRDQVEMLKEAKCDYIQGFVFDKPMNVESFEQRAFGEKEQEVTCK